MKRIFEWFLLKNVPSACTVYIRGSSPRLRTESAKNKHLKNLIAFWYLKNHHFGNFISSVLCEFSALWVFNSTFHIFTKFSSFFYCCWIKQSQTISVIFIQPMTVANLQMSYHIHNKEVFLFIILPNWTLIKLWDQD